MRAIGSSFTNKFAKGSSINNLVLCGGILND